MTHEPNYANDRLALYTFEGLLKFIKCWTNLKLKTLAPADLTTLYFNMFPDEQLPVWRVSHIALTQSNRFTQCLFVILHSIVKDARLRGLTVAVKVLLFVAVAMQRQATQGDLGAVEEM